MHTERTFSEREGSFWATTKQCAGEFCPLFIRKYLDSGPLPIFIPGDGRQIMDCFGQPL